MAQYPLQERSLNCATKVQFVRHTRVAMVPPHLHFALYQQPITNNQQLYTVGEVSINRSMR
jgi:hypothetical protein